MSSILTQRMPSKISSEGSLSLTDKRIRADNRARGASTPEMSPSFRPLALEKQYHAWTQQFANGPSENSCKEKPSITVEKAHRLHSARLAAKNADRHPKPGRASLESPLGAGFLTVQTGSRSSAVLGEKHLDFVVSGDILRTEEWFFCSSPETGSSFGK
jgi:hypothetical protein